MNKLVRIFNEGIELGVVKIDSATASTLKKGETESFEIAGGLKGVFDYEKQCVFVELKQLNFLEKTKVLNGLQTAKQGFNNVLLKDSQVKALYKEGKTLKDVTFTTIPNLAFELWVNQETK